jgi:thiol-disulfide isomerase/thioredoxin
MKKYVVITALLAGAAALLQAQDAVSLALKSKGASSSIGWYAPQQLSLSVAALVTAKKLPPDLKSPLYGLLRFGPAGVMATVPFQVILDEPPGGPSRLFIDANADGDLTNDPAAEWKPSTGSNKLTTWSGGAWVPMGSDPGSIRVWLSFYRFDPKDPDRQAYKQVLFYYRDYDYEGTITLAGKTYRAALSDENARGDFRGTQINLADESAASGVQLLVDLNGNHVYQYPVERIDVRRPFNIGGVTYELADMSARGDTFRLVHSTQLAVERKPPPDLSVGKVFPSFTATDMDGKGVNFPADFKGKMVIVDFWATWCGPCVADVPFLVKAYKETAARGIEVLGISLDDADQDRQVRAFTAAKGMTWREIYDGGGWKAALAQRFLIDAIPATFLVDGDTGVIIAAEGSLRGTSISSTLDRALKAKGR